MANTETFSAADLSYFTGSENWYRVPLFGNVTVTDGVHFIMGRGCSWMATDILAVVKLEKKVRAEDFVSVKFRKNVDGSAVITYDDGNGNVLFRQSYDVADCPINEIDFYFTNDVLMLTSEY
jgi:hypothetical protein